MPLDIGVGILLALGVAGFFHVHASLFLIAFGIACALLPDIDIVTLPLLGKWHHRTHTHYPLMYVPFVLFAFLLVPPMYGLLFALGVYAHLIHDTFGIGWGIAWSWPFSGRKFLLFPAKDRGLPFGLVASWNPEEEAHLYETGHDEHWVRHYYFRPTTLAYIEYGVLAVAIVALVRYFH